MKASVDKARKALRSEIGAAFPRLIASQIFDKILPPGNKALIFEDLAQFGEKCGVTQASMPSIFDVYGVRNGLISKEHFKRFLNEEFPEPIPSKPKAEITEMQAAILSKFCSAIRSRVLSPHNSSLWIFVTRNNPPNSSSSEVRLSTLCRLCSEFNLAFQVEDFIESMFAFIGARKETLSFDQFNELLQSFP